MAHAQKEPARSVESSGYFGPESMSPLLRVGGNATLKNGNEFNTTDSAIESVPCMYADPAYQENNSHVQGIYREMGY